MINNVAIKSILGSWYWIWDQVLMMCQDKGACVNMGLIKKYVADSKTLFVGMATDTVYYWDFGVNYSTNLGKQNQKEARFWEWWLVLREIWWLGLPCEQGMISLLFPWLLDIRVSMILIICHKSLPNLSIRIRQWNRSHKDRLEDRCAFVISAVLITTTRHTHLNSTNQKWYSKIASDWSNKGSQHLTNRFAWSSIVYPTTARFQWEQHMHFNSDWKKW